MAGGEEVTATGGGWIMEEDGQTGGFRERGRGEAGYVVPPGGAAPPRLIIADVAEPQSADDRIAALRAVYAAPILLLSARFRRGLGSSADAALRLGVQKVLPKPFTRSELLAAVSDSISP